MERQTICGVMNPFSPIATHHKPPRIHSQLFRHPHQSMPHQSNSTTLRSRIEEKHAPCAGPRFRRKSNQGVPGRFRRDSGVVGQIDEMDPGGEVDLNLMGWGEGDARDRADGRGRDAGGQAREAVNIGSEVPASCPLPPTHKVSILRHALAALCLWKRSQQIPRGMADPVACFPRARPEHSHAQLKA